ncbi:MAG: ribonuclease P protein component [Planctomycetes bacterium]|nr:ribonuclease P protein component [Planctomycetota bacterium]
MSECLSRANRLRKASGFQEVFKRALPASNAALVIFALRNGAAGTPRLGLAVGRKAGGAVERNRLKRRLRAIFRRHASRLPAADIVVVARACAADLSAGELEEAFMRLTGESLNRTGK